MKALKYSFLALLISSIAQTALGQGISAIIVYENQTIGLGCGCNAGTRVPFADGTNSWCVFWDRTANGADANDLIVPVGDNAVPGNCDVNCFPFNGEALLGVPGTFVSETAFYINTPPLAPDQPVYFVKASGANCCWVSDTFRLAVGLQDIILTEGSWSCTDVACPIGTAPNEVTNVEVSDDTRCTQVEVTWAHDGENLTGFALYIRDPESNEWVYARQALETQRSFVVDVCVDGAVEIGVQAQNGSATADIVAGVGRTFLRHFDPVNEYDRVGQDLTMYLVSPPLGDLCGAILYFDLYSGGTFLQRLCEVTDPDERYLDTLTCTLPEAVPDRNCMVVMIDSSTGFAATGCGLRDTIEFDYLTSADDAPGVPREFSLEQNYPNPFNPTTKIEFALPKEGDVELTIYNLAGQLVTTLISGKQTAGRHAIEWNAAGASTGMYFYRLQMGNQILTRKMLLLK